MKGETIIEVLVALAIGVTILSSITLAVITALKNTTQSTSQQQATQYAHSAIEKIRIMKENNFSAFLSLPNTTYCFADSCTSLSTNSGSCGPKGVECGLNVANRYIREVTLQHNVSSCEEATNDPTLTQSKLTVTVSWKDNTCTDVNNPYCHKTIVETCLSSYSTKKSP